MNFSTKKILFSALLFIMIFLFIINTVRVVLPHIPYFSDWSMMGQNKATADFILFWANILTAAVSLSMVIVTAKSVELNENQLNELKRQWEEEHKPYLSCHLIVHRNIFRLCVTNSSNVVAKDVHVSIDNFLDKEPLRFENLKAFFEHQLFLIPPQDSIYFNLLISAYPEEEHLPKGHLLVSIKCGDLDYGDYKLYPSNHAYVIYGNDSSESDISNKLEDLNKTIKNKKFI